MELTRTKWTLCRPAFRTGRQGRKERFELWFGPPMRLVWDGQVLAIIAPTQFFSIGFARTFGAVIDRGLPVGPWPSPPLEFRIGAADQVAGLTGCIAGAQLGGQPSTQSV